ncbi:MAG: hypothetical protein K0S56_1393 [Microvirga sp.]|jgi:hypothetical protein|nr:hypothetical protein [Microvirga sp.]
MAIWGRQCSDLCTGGRTGGAPVMASHLRGTRSSEAVAAGVSGLIDCEGLQARGD